MTRIRLDADTLAKFEAAEGRVILCDEGGRPVRIVEVAAFPDREPVLPPEEWKRRASEPGGMTTPQLLDYLKSLG